MLLVFTFLNSQHNSISHHYLNIITRLENIFSVLGVVLTEKLKFLSNMKFHSILQNNQKIFIYIKHFHSNIANL